MRLLESWPCNCIFCRVFVHPILRRFASPKPLPKPEKQANELGLEEGGATAKQVPQETSSTPPIDFDKLTKAVSDQVSLLVDSKLRELSTRIDAVEAEVKKVREEMSKSIEDLRTSLVDIRAVIDELTNPFNILRSFVSASKEQPPNVDRIIESFEKVTEMLVKKGQSTASAPSSQGGVADAHAGKVSEFLENLRREAKVGEAPSKPGLLALVRLIKWADDMLSRVPKEVVEEIARFMRIANVIGEDEEKLILNVLEFVYKSRKLGMKISEQVMYIYNLAKVFGVEDKEASEEVLKLAMDSGMG